MAIRGTAVFKVAAQSRADYAKSSCEKADFGIITLHYQYFSGDSSPMLPAFTHPHTQDVINYPPDSVCV